MSITFRQCRGPADFPVISDFLAQLYRPENRDGNWFQAIWEYAYTHPMFDEAAVSRIGIWESAGQVVAVASYELRLGEAFFNVHPAYEHLKGEMLAYAEEHLAAAGNDGKRRLNAFASEFDVSFEQTLIARGYRRHPSADRLMSQFIIPSCFPEMRLPGGFRLKSLADENDLRKVRRVFYRGFDHGDEPPADGTGGIERMQTSPHYRKDLNIVVEAPDGQFVSYGGIWYDAGHHFGYVEPVATDPAYRRRGLARAAVLEGIRRCAELGATVAYVAATKPLYLAIGFRKLHTNNCWQKEV